MPPEEAPQLPAERYYYSAHHLARDVIGTAAPFTLFAITLLAVSPSLQNILRHQLSSVAEPIDWSVVVIVFIIYLLVAFIAGILLNRVILLYRIIPGLRRFGVDLRRFYDANREGIATWYRAYIYDCAELTSVRSDNSVQYVDRLICLLRLYNPAGYSHVYREYMFMFIYRQSIVYAFTLTVILSIQSRWIPAAASLSATAVLYISATSGLHDAVQAEFNFIVATITWLERSGRFHTPFTQSVTGERDVNR